MIKPFSKTLVLGGVLLMMYFSCKDNGVVPPGEDCRPSVPTDTTSHNFIWRFDTLGEGNGSVLNDVAIINDTTVWTVGELSLKDSAGQFIYPPYNVAKWNGQKWQLSTSADSGYLYGALNSVFVFSNEDVWAGSTIPEHWDGKKWTFYGSARGWPGSFYIKKIFGTSSSNLYFVGTNGSIVHYNGASWQKLTSGTTIDIQDIWGGVNCKGEVEILAVASNRIDIPQGKMLLALQGTSVSPVNDNGLSVDLSSVWFIPRGKYFVTGSGVFTATQLGVDWTRDLTQPSVYANAIRGQGSNDIVIAGSYGLVSHYNGSTWKHYLGNEVPEFFGAYNAVAFKNNLMIAVGWKGEQGVILTGKRF